MSAIDTLLLFGYVLAVPFTLFVPGFIRLWRRREVEVFVTAQLGALLITVGWALKSNLPAAIVNGCWLVGLTVAWTLHGRKRARPAT